MTHAVFIRGINVGGKNAVPMAGLRAALTEAGASDVATYIQSGNVVMCLEADDAEAASLVECVLREHFGVSTVAVAISGNALREVVARAPEGFGADDDTYKHDVVFLRPGVDPVATLDKVRVRDGVDAAWAGPACLYFRRVSAKVTGSYLKHIMTMPEYQHMTIRNWRTTGAVLALVEKLPT